MIIGVTHDQDGRVAQRLSVPAMHCPAHNPLPPVCMNAAR